MMELKERADENEVVKLWKISLWQEVIIPRNSRLDCKNASQITDSI